MISIKQIILIACGNYRKWHKNPKVIMIFLMGFVVSFLLTDKVMQFAKTWNTIFQVAEPFIWTFGDAQSVLIISLLLLLLFADMPDLDNHVPLQLVRINRIVWLLGQIVYLVTATMLYLLFILGSSCILVARRAFLGNQWSETAAIFGYSEIGSNRAVPSYVKVMEFNSPYTCMLHVFGLMVGYCLLMVSIVLFLNLWKKKGGILGGVVFSGLGFLLTPEVILSLFDLMREQQNIANIIFGWISPLNHATYYMHSFGYDNLPKLWVSYLFFMVGSLVFFVLSLLKIRRYAFDFTGTRV